VGYLKQLLDEHERQLDGALPRRWGRRRIRDIRQFSIDASQRE
jgi:hypothetical protein